MVLRPTSMSGSAPAKELRIALHMATWGCVSTPDRIWCGVLSSYQDRVIPAGSLVAQLASAAGRSSARQL